MEPEEKVKHIDLPDVAKAEITNMNQGLNHYLAGVAAGMGIKGKWSFDLRAMQFIVEEKQKE